MGIIIRNGIPYGAADSKDITTVSTFSDLGDLAVKLTDHIYVVDDEHLGYYYDDTNDEFKPLIKNIPASLNEIIVGDGNNWAKRNSSNYFITSTSEKDDSSSNPSGETIGRREINAQSANLWTQFGAIGDQAGLPYLKNGFKSKDNGIASIWGNAKLYMDGTSRLAIHDNAWLDVTGEGTSVKFNSGSKFFVDTTVGANNFMMHGGWFAISDGRVSLTTITFRYQFLKSQYSELPYDNYTDIMENCEYLTSSWAKPNPKYENGVPTADVNAITTMCNDLAPGQDFLNYGFVINENESSINEYTSSWEVYIKTTYKTPNSEAAVNTGFNEAFRYTESQSDYPNDAMNVPRFNISGAPHVLIEGKNNIMIKQNSFFNMERHSFVSLDSANVDMRNDAYVQMSSFTKGMHHPFVQMITGASPQTSGGTSNQVVLGFGTTEFTHENSYGYGDPIQSSMLIHTASDPFCASQGMVSNKGPLGYFPAMTFSISSNTMTRSIFNSTIATKNNYQYKFGDLCPYVFLKEKVYINIDPYADGTCYIYPSIHAGATYDYVPYLAPSSKYVIADRCGSAASHIRQIGVDNSAELVNYWHIESSAKMNIDIEPRTNSQTFITCFPGASSENVFFMDSGPSAKIGMKISVGGSTSSYHFVNGTKTAHVNGEQLQVLVESSDAMFVLKDYAHSEMSDYSRFIMRGENNTYNTSTTPYVDDPSQMNPGNSGNGGNDLYKHMQLNWYRPFDNDYVDNANSPTFQMYESSNLILRGHWFYPHEEIEFSSSTYSTVTGQIEITFADIRNNPTDLAAFEAALPANTAFIGIAPNSHIYATSTTITVEDARLIYTNKGKYGPTTYHPNAGLNAEGKRSSVLEITDNSELRLWDGISIYGRFDPDTGKPTIDFINKYGCDADTDTYVEKVSFTFDELRALKALLAQPRLAQMTQSQYDQLDPPDANTVYVIQSEPQLNALFVPNETVTEEPVEEPAEPVEEP